MRKKPIIMGAESVRAILDGRKTMTRRVVGKRALERFEFSPSGELIGSFNESHPEWEIYPTVDDSPYHVGDRLWVRETFRIAEGITINGIAVIYKANCSGFALENIDNWKSPIFMPRWASRITLEITDIRVERVQNITCEDVIKEGVPTPYVARDNFEPISMYRELWDSLNAKRGYSWESNPWVWVISFKRVKE